MESKSKRIWIKRIGLICLIPVLLIILVGILLYIPPVQNLAVKKVSSYASESLGMNIEVGYIHLSFPLNLNVKDVSVVDHENDTLLYSHDLTLEVRLLPLLDKNIAVRTLQLENVRFNTKTLIKGIMVSGDIGNLNANADNILLSEEKIIVNNLLLADSHISLRMDTVSSSDTTTSTQKWKIELDKIKLEKISFNLDMPVDSIRLNSYFDHVLLTGGNVDLEKQKYSVAQFEVLNTNINYDSGERYLTRGLDPSHLALSDINIDLASLLYESKNINAQIRQLSLSEQSGLVITSLNGEISSNESTLTIPDLSLQTLYSKIDAQATIPWSSLDTVPKGSLTTQLVISLDKRDLIAVLGELPESVEPFYPDATFKLTGLVEGNLDKIYLRQLESELPGVFMIDAHGIAEKVTDEMVRSGEFYLKAQTNSESYLRGVLLKESGGRYAIPEYMLLNMRASLSKGMYHINMLLSELSGKVELAGNYHPVRQEYGLDLKVDSLALIHFLPEDSIFSVTANIEAQGKGIDFFADDTWSKFKVKLNELVYKQNLISGISFEGALEDHQLKANLVSTYPYLQSNMTVDGNITKEKISGMLIVDVDTLDLYGLQVTERPFTNSFQLFSEVETDLKNTHLIDVTLGNWEMMFGQQRVKPKTLTLHAKGSDDTTYVSFHAGDFGIYLKGNADVQTLVNKLTVVSNDVMRQLEEDSTVNLQQLRPLLPEVDLQIAANRDNPIYNYLQLNNIFFDHFELNAATSPEQGINANGFLYAFIKDTLKIDSIQLGVHQDSNKLNYAVNVVKNKFRQQEPFKAGLKGSLQYGQGDLEATYLNEKGETGLHLGAQIEKQPEGWNIQLFPENPVIAFLPFKVNPDNYILFKNKEDIAANLRLDGEEYASIWVHSEEEEGKMKELSAELSQIDLQKLSSGFPRFIPPLGGNANLSLRYTPMENTFMVVADAGVDDLYYQKGRIGELLLSGVYLPLDNSQHQVDMHIYHDQNEVSVLTALYQSAQGGNIDGKVGINQLPLMMLDPFLTGMARLNGALLGTMSMKGTVQAPLLNGYMQMDTAAVYVTMAGSQLKLDDKKINVTDSKISFDKYSIYSAGNNPFVIDGIVDIRNLSKGTADLTLTARNMQLLDAQKDNESLVYGKLFVDLNSTVKGPFNALTMRGNLHLLGGTNMSYILRESPLTVRDRMSGLVTFTYFQDTIPRRNRIGNIRGSGIRRETASLNSGMDMLMTINIDPAVKIKVDLDEEASNRIEVQGGGDLSFQYTRQGDMVLNGRYTLSNGVLKYDMPVIGNKTLNIQEDSYVEWSGEAMDPYLNLKATERVRSSVNQGNASRLVTFDAGVEIKQRLEDLSLQFTLDAVDDITIQNQLASLASEEESKRAVAMLVTGRYISEDQGGNMGFDMGSALNNFLSNEINSLTGDLLSGADFSFGMETYDMTGGRRTDYTFSFSKRFYNDRLNVIVGGALSSGEMANENDNFLNNASLEYRLDRGGNKYAKLFYNRQYESLLEGEIARFGGGFIFRRKMRRLNELFGRRNRKPVVTQNVFQENEK